MKKVCVKDEPYCFIFMKKRKPLGRRKAHLSLKGIDFMQSVPQHSTTKAVYVRGPSVCLVYTFTRHEMLSAYYLNSKRSDEY